MNPRRLDRDTKPVHMKEHYYKAKKLEIHFITDQPSGPQTIEIKRIAVSVRAPARTRQATAVKGGVL